jgi:hypothetical protein
MGVLDRRLVASICGQRDCIGVRMDYRCFVAIAVLLVSGPYMHVLIGCYEERL